MQINQRCKINITGNCIMIVVLLTACGADPDDNPDLDGGGPDGGDTAPCEAETNAGDVCSEQDALCTTATSCCRCIGFDQAPTCGLLWDCAIPANNDAACPATPPALDAVCTPIKLRCQYCSKGAPAYYSCSRETTDTDSGLWKSTSGLECFE